MLMHAAPSGDNPSKDQLDEAEGSLRMMPAFFNCHPDRRKFTSKLFIVVDFLIFSLP